MVAKDSANKSSATPLHLGEAAIVLHRELLEAYEQVSRAWLTRVQVELALWSELATQLAAVRSGPEALEAYMRCASRQVQMTAEDGERLFKDCQEITQKITKSITDPTTFRKQTKSNGHPLSH
jgi:hypothetical protein